MKEDELKIGDIVFVNGYSDVFTITRIFSSENLYELIDNSYDISNHLYAYIIWRERSAIQLCTKGVKVAKNTGII